MHVLATTHATGTLALKTIRCPSAPLMWRIRNFVENRLRDLPRLILARVLHMGKVPMVTSALYLKIYRQADQQWYDCGLVGTRVVTNAGVAAIVNGFLNSVNISTFNYHGLGTGTNAESASDTALQTELTTQYASANTRPTGVQTASSANVYQTVATVTVNTTVAATEHGIFTQAATGGGTLLDRTKFTVVNLAAGDGIQATYQFTITSGS